MFSFPVQGFGSIHVANGRGRRHRHRTPHTHLSIEPPASAPAASRRTRRTSATITTACNTITGPVHRRRFPPHAPPATLRHRLRSTFKAFCRVPTTGSKPSSRRPASRSMLSDPYIEFTPVGFSSTLPAAYRRVRNLLPEVRRLRPSGVATRRNSDGMQRTEFNSMHQRVSGNTHQSHRLLLCGAQVGRTHWGERAMLCYWCVP